MRTACRSCWPSRSPKPRAKIASGHRVALAADGKAVRDAPTLAWVCTLEVQVVERWSGNHPQLAQWLEAAPADDLACFAFPATQCLRIRSTDGLDRFRAGVRAPHSSGAELPNADACLRVVTALCVAPPEERGGRTQREAAAGHEREEVTSLAS